MGNSKFIYFCCVACLIYSAFMGCTSAMTSMMGNISSAVLNNNDLATVEAGCPAYLIMIDGFIKQEPKNPDLLAKAASLYSSYANIFTKDKDRAKRLSDKALNYALQAMCINSNACSLKQDDFNKFEMIIDKTSLSDILYLFALGESWASWIQNNKDNLDAIAQISKVEKIMHQVLKLDESYQNGAAHLYLGVLSTILPPALGGKPEVGHKHFEKALQISGGKNLMTKVIYAKQYAKVVYDKILYDRLLREVLVANPNVDGLVLTNTLAQKQAKELLETSQDIFN